MKKPIYKNRIFIVLSVTVLLLIILFVWAIDYPLYKTPKPKDIIGFWLPNLELRHKVSPEPPPSFYKVRLEIYSDNTFKLINVPNGFIDNKSKKEAYSGSWSISDGSSEGCASLNVKYDEINLYSNFMICGRTFPYLIEHYTAAPQELIYFSKQ